MPSYKTEAINLRSKRFSEADKLLSVFTRQRGKVSAIAKSAFKPSSKYGGRLEVFGYNNLLLAEGKNLDILSQAETIESFHKVREKESSLNAGLYIAKVLFYFLEERVPREPLFELMLGSLRLLKHGFDPASVTRIFDVRLADIEGFLPVERFSSDLQCRITGVKSGSDMPNFSLEEIKNIDLVLAPGISEHVGKDVSLWKNM
ncbi:MAG: DNA repair protein RecO [Candidatus Margulisiibacteriota bacterium]